jgi:hypothetical protein
MFKEKKMKNKLFKFLLAAVLTVGFAGFAHADAYDFAYKNINEFPVNSSAPASGDYTFRFVAADNKVEKVAGTSSIITGAFNGTVGATTPSTGAFTTVTTTGALTPKSLVIGATGTVDISPTFSTALNANPEIKYAYGTCTVAAVNGGTCIPLALAAGRTISVMNFDIVATGSAATCTGVKLEDTNGTPVVIATLSAATLTSGAHNVPLTATLGVGFGAGSGLTTSQGVQILVNGSACTTTTAFQYAISYAVQ